MFPLQQAYNAAVAINHMKKLQLANSEQVLRKVSIPGIKVVDVSSPANHRKRLNPDKLDPKELNGNVQETNHMALPTSHVDLKVHYQPLKACHSQAVHHTPSMAEQGKNVYQSEPANLNGSVLIYEL